MQEQTTDRKDLKIQALLEKLGNDKMQHENEIAEMRVELTLLRQELEAITKVNEEAQVEEDTST